MARRRRRPHLARAGARPRPRESAGRRVGDWAHDRHRRSRTQLQHDLHDAMRARDKVRSGTLRMTLTSITNAEVAGDEARELSDDEVLKVVAKEAKKRKEAVGGVHRRRPARAGRGRGGRARRARGATCRRSSATTSCAAHRRAGRRVDRCDRDAADGPGHEGRPGARWPDAPTAAGWPPSSSRCCPGAEPRPGARSARPCGARSARCFPPSAPPPAGPVCPCCLAVAVGCGSRLLVAALARWRCTARSSTPGKAEPAGSV